MFMYWAKRLAVDPLSTVLLATEQLGIASLETSRPAFAASALMPAGVKSGVPVIVCSARLLWTVL
jgi:hypothetical protein